ncbi:diguanylate cyclase [Pelomonas sp. CA6]|uniref:diguanylate cyclase domain-containing protein n=1 Tax=Pelomonas sp. CA6 TaxID=2907999 RepID=UPI001F4C1B3E|nr:diguanylate cyclase [Pelomonas sp. CA6]MCH7343178.1 diguanylate cyclase [Pelomonas sp. CA6]
MPERLLLDRDRILLRYLLALAIFTVATALRMVLIPVEVRLTYATYYPAVVLALYFCGVGPGLLVMVFSSAVGVYFLSPPYHSWHSDRPGNFALIAFVFTSLACAYVVQRLRSLSRDLFAANQRARQSQRELQTVIDDQTDMLFRFDREGHFLLANPAGRAAFGLEGQDLSNKTWHLLVGPEDRPAVDARLARLKPDNPVVVTESRFRNPKGRLRWGEFVHRASYDEDGRLLQVQTVGRDITERRELKAQLLEITARMHDLYDSAPCAYYSLDAQGKFCQANAVMLNWLGCSEEELMGRLGPRDFFTPEDQRRFDEHFPKFLRDGVIGPLEFDLQGRQGPPRRVSVSATAVWDAQGRFERSRSVMYDITELDATRKALRQLNRQQEAMLDNDLIGILKLRERRIVWSNRASERMFACGPGELLGLESRALYRTQEEYEEFGRVAYPVLQAGAPYRGQLQLLRRDGRPVWVDVSGALLSPETGEYLWMSLDITALKAQQERVEHVAFHDGLTGLPNRLLLMDRLRQAVQLSRRTQECLAVCFLDLNGFKPVNDRHGHAAGDELLRELGRRLLAGVRAHDTVARVGGDEFVLLLPALHDRQECELILARLRAEIARPVALPSGVWVRVTTSVGYALCPDDGLSEDELLAHADRAMYADKAGHKTAAPHDPGGPQG